MALFFLDKIIKLIISVADTRTVTRTPHPHTRDHHSPALVEARPRRTGSGAETAGMTGKSRDGGMTVQSRGETLNF